MITGERLFQLRNRRGYSQYILSQKSGVSQSFISAIEAGNKSPTISTLRKLCDSLGITLAEFFYENSYNIPPALHKLVKECRYLTSEQNEMLSSFLNSIRTTKY